MSDLRLPPDFQRWPEMIELSRHPAAASPPERAVWLLHRLWVELYYEVEVTGRPGFMSLRSAERFATETLGGETLGALAASGLMVAQDGGYFCARFARLHPHLDPNKLSMQQKGNLVSRYVRRMGKLDRQVTQQSLILPPELFRAPDGAPMDAEVTRRVMLLIRACDFALSRPERPCTEAGFPQPLIHDAWRVLQQYRPEQIDGVFRAVSIQTAHPAIPHTTEQFLPRFGEIAAALSAHAA